MSAMGMFFGKQSKFSVNKNDLDDVVRYAEQLVILADSHNCSGNLNDMNSNLQEAKSALNSNSATVQVERTVLQNVINYADAWILYNESNGVSISSIKNSLDNVKVAIQYRDLGRLPAREILKDIQP